MYSQKNRQFNNELTDSESNTKSQGSFTDGDSWQYFSTWLKKDMCKNWEKVLDFAKPKMLQKNEIIRGDGNIFNGFYYIKQGIVRFLSSDINGTEAIMLYITKGNLFGECAYFNRLGVYINFSAVDDCILYYFDKWTLDSKIIPYYPELKDTILCYMAYKVGVLLHHQSEFLTDNIFGKVCRFIYNIAQYYDLPKNLSIKISQKEIANVLGIHRATFSACLHQLKVKGICEWKGTKKIVIYDYQKLIANTTNMFLL